jgi:preprotein translocase subunit SecD
MQKCTICIHPQREEIDEKLLLSATPLRTIADQFGVSKTALLRHKADHIPTDLVKAKDAKEICRAESLLDKLASLKFDAERITQKAEIKDDLKTASRSWQKCKDRSNNQRLI